MLRRVASFEDSLLLLAAPDQITSWPAVASAVQHLLSLSHLWSDA